MREATLLSSCVRVVLPRWKRTCKFFPRAARAVLRGENSSREPREPFSGVIFALASRGGFFTGWYLLSRVAAAFLRGDICSREPRRPFFRVKLLLASCGKISQKKIEKNLVDWKIYTMFAVEKLEGEVLQREKQTNTEANFRKFFLKEADTQHQAS